MARRMFRSLFRIDVGIFIRKRLPIVNANIKKVLLLPFSSAVVSRVLCILARIN